MIKPLRFFPALLLCLPVFQLTASPCRAGGVSDLIFMQQSSGQIGDWVLNDGTPVSYPMIGVMSDPDWQIVGAGDLTGNGLTDLVWRQGSTGLIAAWILDGNRNPVDYPTIGQVSDPDWRIVGVGDLTGNGRADLVWQQRSTGLIAAWILDENLQPVSYPVIGQSSDPDWRLVGVGDFNGDGRADLLWQQNSTGLVGAWILGSDLAPVDYPIIGQVSDPDWRIVGTSDLYGRGQADILWQQSSTGLVAAWVLDDTLTPASYPAVGTESDPNWEIVGAR